MNAKHVAESLQAARVTAGLTGEELAARLGVTRQTVSNWENGGSPLGPARILMAQIFNVSLEIVDSWFAKNEAIA